MLSPSVCRLSVVCLSVTLVRPTQAVQIFRNISTALGILWPSIDIRGKFYGDRPSLPDPIEKNMHYVSDVYRSSA